MSDNNTTTYSGISLSGAVFLVFLVLKLLGKTVVATWSWWWVTSPLWIPILVALIVVGVLVVPIFISGKKLFP